MSETTLFGPDEGWSLEPVAAWLLTEGRVVQDAVALITELTARLDSAGANFLAIADRFLTQAAQRK